MTPVGWRFPVLACALGIVTSCAANPASPPVIVGKIEPAGITDAPDPPGLARTTNAPATASPAEAGTTSATAANTEGPLPPFDRRILAAHNHERLGLGLTPLTWSPALAQMAQRWADYLAATGRFEHAPENRLAPEGENLWAGTKGYYSPEAKVDAWIREKRFFRQGVFPDNSITGKVEDVGHYTQVVWRATTEVGCAQATGTREDILVCRYAEAGNYRGEQPF